MHTQQKELEGEGETEFCIMLIHFRDMEVGWEIYISPLALECMTDLRDIEGGWELDLLFFHIMSHIRFMIN